MAVKEYRVKKSGFCGKPIIAWSIETALESGCFDRVLVSTDDREIAQVPLASGAEVPFLRPRELSYDYTGTTQVIAHAIQWQNTNQTPATYMCCIYATVPCLKVEDLRRGLDLLQSHDEEYAFGVTRYAFSIQRAIHITSEQTVKMFGSSLLSVGQ